MKYQLSAVIVVNSAIVAAGLSFIINKTNNIRIVGLYSSHLELMLHLQRHSLRPSIAIVDTPDIAGK